MSRKQLQRNLPPLRKLFFAFHGFRASDNRTVLLAEHLRRAVSRVRTAETRPFYAMREVAGFFGMPVSKVALAYRKLAAEGALTSVRGSATFVPGHRMHPRRAIRAVAGLPIWLPGFSTLQHWPRFYRNVDPELRAQNILPTYLFYKNHEEVNPQFAEDILARRLDLVIWLFPLPSARNTMLLLEDYGVPLVVLGDGTWTFPGQQFRLNWDAAICQCLDTWQRAGLKSVVISRPPAASSIQTDHPIHGHDLQTLQRALTARRIKCDCSEAPNGYYDRYLNGLAAGPAGGIIFVNFFWIATLFSQAPAEMTRLMETHRVLLCRLPASVPEPASPRARADVLFMNYGQVARRVARTIMAGRWRRPETPAEIAAEYHGRLDLKALRDYAEM